VRIEYLKTEDDFKHIQDFMVPWASLKEAEEWRDGGVEA